MNFFNVNKDSVVFIGGTDYDKIFVEYETGKVLKGRGKLEKVKYDEKNFWLEVIYDHKFLIKVKYGQKFSLCEICQIILLKVKYGHNFFYDQKILSRSKIRP